LQAKRALANRTYDADNLRRYHYYPIGTPVDGDDFPPGEYGS